MAYFRHDSLPKYHNHHQQQKNSSTTCRQCGGYKDFGMIDSTLNASNLLLSNCIASEESLDNAVEIREVFFNELEDRRDTLVQRSVDLKSNSLALDIRYVTPEFNHDLNVQQNMVGETTEVLDTRHLQENNALLKVWNATASEFLLIPCQLEGLKPSPSVVDDHADPAPSASTSRAGPTTKIYQCAVCDTNLDELSSLLLHYEQVHRLFKCPFCVKHFARSHQLRMHLFVHSDRREFACAVCSKRFKRKPDLQQHVKCQHSADAFAAESFLCDSCGFQSKSKSSIRSHVLGHLGATSFTCDVCDKRCKNKVDLMAHRNTHFNIKSYQCDVCKAVFTRKEAMLKHCRTLHEGVYSFMCDICGRPFLHKTSLTIHLKLHAGENQVECDICGRKMSGKVALLNHKKMHTQQRDFACGICGKTYINKYSLQEHLLVHTGSNPFQCLQCDNSFSSRKKLLMHERIHDPHRTLYKCSGCEKSYTSKFKLQEHFNKHQTL